MNDDVKVNTAEESSVTNETLSTESEPEAEAEVTSESFQNCKEMRKVHPNGVASDHPAYASKQTEITIIGHVKDKEYIDRL